MRYVNLGFAVIAAFGAIGALVMAITSDGTEAAAWMAAFWAAWAASYAARAKQG